MHRTLEAIAARSRELRREAQAAGLFTHDRELLDCPACDLREDVTAEGYLFSYFGKKTRPDSGLRFQETCERGVWTCPACGARVLEPEGW